MIHLDIPAAAAWQTLPPEDAARPLRADVKHSLSAYTVLGGWKNLAFTGNRGVRILKKVEHQLRNPGKSFREG